MPRLKDHSLSVYLKVLSQRTPVPGGGSAAALAAALGAALISMVANYSLGKGTAPAVRSKIKAVLKQSEKIRLRLERLVDLDAQAYLKVVQTRKASPAKRKAALKGAQEVPLEVGRLCYAAVGLTPVLVAQGNKYLVSDVEVALELLWAGYRSAMINVRINQE